MVARHDVARVEGAQKLDDQECEQSNDETQAPSASHRICAVLPDRATVAILEMGGSALVCGMHALVRKTVQGRGRLRVELNLFCTRLLSGSGTTSIEQDVYLISENLIKSACDLSCNCMVRSRIV